MKRARREPQWVPVVMPAHMRPSAAKEVRHHLMGIIEHRRYWAVQA